MKPIHILVLILLTTFTLINTKDLRNEENKGENNKIEILKKDLEKFKSHFETKTTLINNLLKILEEENVSEEIYDGIALFKVRLQISKVRDIPPVKFLKYIEAVEGIIKKHNESKVIKENKE